MPTRICSKCKQIKDLEKDFYAAKGYRGGYMPRCKQCVLKDPSQCTEQVLLRVAKLRQRNRQFIWDYYSTHPCVDCGENDPIVLELDHVRGEKVAGVSQLVHNTRSLKVIEDEIAKCEVVCANCHRRRTADTQGWFADVS